jgi:transposase
MKKINKKSAGIDIGAKKVFVFVEGCEVKSFLTFTEDLQLLVDYLLAENVETLAMEATGSYWFILYELIEASGIDVWLVDGRETRQVPGRKTDVKDCQWIQELHSHGLFKRCYVATSSIKELRSYHRLREDHIRSATMHVNHMQKALIEMNIRLKEVISQIHGSSGIKIIQAILKGERNTEVLLNMCHARIIKHKRTEVLKALRGKYTKAGLFALKQAFDSYQFYQQQIAACDKEIERVIHDSGKGSKDKDLPAKRKPVRHNKPQVEDLGANMIDIFDGKDATLVSGITDYSWLKLLAETGTDLTRWMSSKHFTSWLGLAPGQHWSGKKQRNKKKKGKPKAGQIFREIAQSLIESKHTAIGAFGRRIRSKKGPAIAIKAVARKVAIQYYNVIVHGLDFVEKGVKNYEKLLLARKHRSLEKLAKELNVQVVT